VVGRVWVVEIGAKPALSTPAEVATFNSDINAKKNYLRVLTTICPHLGCSVNLDAAGTGFLCPCHAATFTVDGIKAGPDNVAPRDMDSLVWQIDPANPNRIQVKFQAFKASERTSIAI